MGISGTASISVPRLNRRSRSLGIIIVISVATATTAVAQQKPSDSSRVSQAHLSPSLRHAEQLIQNGELDQAKILIEGRSFRDAVLQMCFGFGIAVLLNQEDSKIVQGVGVGRA